MNHQSQKPRFLSWIIQKILGRYNRLPALGDLDEEFELIAATSGHHSAYFWYWRQIIKSVPSVLKNLIYWSVDMFKNYLKIALRNLRKNRIYSLINVIGLAVGIACSLLIILYVQDELAYDKFHPNAERIFRVVTSTSDDGQPTNANGITGTGPALKNDFPEVLDYVRIRGMGQSVKRYIAYQNRKFYEDRFYFADPQILTMFNFPLIQGDPKTALAEPNSIVITENMANKYFPGDNPMGEIMEADPHNSGEMMQLQVTGIASNVPDQSHFHFDFLISYVNQKEDLNRFAGLWQHYTYVLLDRPESKKVIEGKLLDFLHRHWTDNPWYTNSLQPLLDIRLHSNLKSEIEQNGNSVYVYVFPLIAGFILMIACINFINMATTQSAQRAKEVGLRKVVGALRSQLVKQFLGEAIIISLLAGLFSLLLIICILPQFNWIADKTFTVANLVNPVLFLGWLGIVIIIGFISGWYVAFVLSRHDPAVTLKGMSRIRQSSWLIREGLVILQFFISVILIVAMLVIQNQIHFIKSHNPGYARNEILVVPLNPEIRQNYDVLKNKLLSMPSVKNVTTSNQVPTRGSMHDPIRVEGCDEAITQVIYFVDKTFIDTYDVPILAGRNLKLETPGRNNVEFLISAKSVSEFGFTLYEDVLDKKITYENFGGFITEGFITGVVGDMHLYSFHTPPYPIVYCVTNIDKHVYLSIRVGISHLHATMQDIRSVWKQIVPGYPLEYFFLDQSFEQMHRNDERMSRVVRLFGVLAIFVACMGLFAMAAYAAEKRRKEIGIRKTLGASGRKIYLMLSKSLLRWVLLSSLLAWPIVYFLMNSWLRNFSTKTDLTLIPFLSGTLIIFIVAGVTISFQTIRAAIANPVDSLRYE